MSQHTYGEPCTPEDPCETCSLDIKEAKAAALDVFVAAIDPMCWGDLGPALTCTEAEAFAEMLRVVVLTTWRRCYLKHTPAGTKRETPTTHQRERFSLAVR